MDLYTAIERQEKESPPVLPVEKYAEYFDKELWKAAKDLVKRKAAKELYRVGRWLVGRWESNCWAILVLNRKGEPELEDCTCVTEKGECKQEAALAILWANKSSAFKEQHLPVSKQMVVWDGKPSSLVDFPSMLKSRKEILEETARNIDAKYKLQEVRALGRAFKVKLGSGRKVELVMRLAQYMMDGEVLFPLIRSLTRDERLAVAAMFLDLESPYAQNVAGFLYRGFEPETPWKDVCDSLADRGLFVYPTTGISPAKLIPGLGEDLFQISTVDLQGEPATSHTPWDLLKIAYQIIAAIDSKEYYLEEVKKPSSLPIQYISHSLFTWHPEWAILPRNISLFPVYFRVKEPRPRDMDALSQGFGIPASVIQAILESLESLHVLYVHENKWTVNHKSLRRFIEWPQRYQLRGLAVDIIQRAGRYAIHSVSQKYSYRFAAHARKDIWWRFPAEMDDCEADLVAVITGFFAMLPPGRWVPWDEVKRFLKVWTNIRAAMAAHVLRFFTDPLEDWQDFFWQFVSELLLIMEHIGALDVARRDGEITHIRVTYLHELTSVVEEMDGALRAGGAEVQSEGDIQVLVRRDHVRIDLPLTASARIMSLLEKWKASPEFKSGKLRFTWTLPAMGELFQKGETPETIFARWEEAAGSAMAATMQEWVQRTFDRFGKVHLYPDVLVVHFQDEITRRHIEAALPDLRKHIRGEVDGNTILLDAGSADELYSVLNKGGYTPKRVRVDIGGRKA